jgi:hypothetical protein
MLVADVVRLVECRACDRHVRVDEAVCRFCGAPQSVPAPRRWALLVGALPLLFGCAGEDAADAPKPGAPADDATPGGAKPPEGKSPEAKSPEPEPAPTTAVRPPLADDDPAEWGQQSMPADLGAKIEPPVEPPEIDRPMATKYGAPPRPADKYGAPPRPAKKYGGPPRPDPGDDPLGGL